MIHEEALSKDRSRNSLEFSKSGGIDSHEANQMHQATLSGGKSRGEQSLRSNTELGNTAAL